MRKQLDKNISFHKLVAYMIGLMTGRPTHCIHLHFQSFTVLKCMQQTIPSDSFSYVMTCGFNSIQLIEQKVLLCIRPKLREIEKML